MLVRRLCCGALRGSQARLSFCMLASRGRMEPAVSQWLRGLTALREQVPTSGLQGPSSLFVSPPSHLTWGPLLALFPAQSAHFSHKYCSLCSLHCGLHHVLKKMTPWPSLLVRDKTGQGWSLARGRVVPPPPSRNVESGSVLRDDSVTVLNICFGSFGEG